MVENSSRWGDPNAQNKLGAICYQGKHGKKDVTVGIDLLQRSAEQGRPEALFNLAICYNKGEGIERNFPKTDQLLAIAHEKGHPTAAMYRVVLYLTKDDFKKKEEWTGDCSSVLGHLSFDERVLTKP